MRPTVIIGGGASGFFSAIHNKIKFPSIPVIIIEKNADVLQKVLISGGGRCNVTHACFDPKALIQFYPRGSRELIGPFHVFQPQDTMNWFESHGVPLKIESDNRVFPNSNTSQSIYDCLVKTAQSLGIKIWTRCTVRTIIKPNDQFQLHLSNHQTLIAQKLVLATGSSRYGYQLAETFGHTICTPHPSLFAFRIPDPQLHRLSGISVNRVKIRLTSNPVRDQSGPILITKTGISGPAVITLSAWSAMDLASCNYHANILINWCAGISEIEPVLSHLKTLKHTPFSHLPNRLWQYLLHRADISLMQDPNTLSKVMFNRLHAILTQCPFTITGKSPFKDEFVTCGGIQLNEVNFKTMESKRCAGLYMVGEILNIDGVTGGFNFQNAWTTGFISGLSHPLYPQKQGIVFT